MGRKKSNKQAKAPQPRRVAATAISNAARHGRYRILGASAANLYGSAEHIQMPFAKGRNPIPTEIYSDLSIGGESVPCVLFLPSNSAVCYLVTLPLSGRPHVVGHSDISGVVTNTANVREWVRMGTRVDLTNQTQQDSKSGSLRIGIAQEVPPIDTWTTATIRAAMQDPLVRSGNFGSISTYAPQGARDAWQLPAAGYLGNDANSRGYEFLEKQVLSSTFDRCAWYGDGTSGTAFGSSNAVQIWGTNVDGANPKTSNTSVMRQIPGMCVLELSLFLRLDGVTATSNYTFWVEIFYLDSSSDLQSVVVPVDNAVAGDDTDTVLVVGINTKVDCRAAMIAAGLSFEPIIDIRLTGARFTSADAITTLGDASASQSQANVVTARIYSENYNDTFSDGWLALLDSDDDVNVHLRSLISYEPTETQSKYSTNQLGRSNMLTRRGTETLYDAIDAVLASNPGGVLRGKVMPTGTVGAFSFGDMMSGVWNKVKDVGKVVLGEAAKAGKVALRNGIVGLLAAEYPLRLTEAGARIRQGAGDLQASGRRGLPSEVKKKVVEETTDEKEVEPFIWGAPLPDGVYRLTKVVIRNAKAYNAVEVVDGKWLPFNLIEASVAHWIAVGVDNFGALPIEINFSDFGEQATEFRIGEKKVRVAFVHLDEVADGMHYEDVYPPPSCFGAVVDEMNLLYSAKPEIFQIPDAMSIVATGRLSDTSSTSICAAIFVALTGGINAYAVTGVPGASAGKLDNFGLPRPNLMVARLGSKSGILDSPIGVKGIIALAPSSAAPEVECLQSYGDLYARTRVAL